MQEPDTGVPLLRTRDPAERTTDGVKGHSSTSYIILKHTQGLRTLTIIDFTFEIPKAFARPDAHPPALQHLFRLDIQRTAHFDSLSTIEYILSLLALVSTVDGLVLSTVWSPGDYHYTLSPSSLPVDKQLRMLYTSGSALSLGLPKVLDMSSLQVLDIPGCFAEDMEWLGIFLGTAGRNLLHLNVQLHDANSVHRSLVPELPPTHLSPLPLLSSLLLWRLSKLETLSFTLPTWSNSEQPFDESTTVFIYEPAHAFIRQTLRALPPSVRSIGLLVEHHNTLYFSDIVQGVPLRDSFLPFADFDAILESRIAEQGLQTVEVMMNNWTYRDRQLVQQCIAKALPKTCARGAMLTKNFTLTFESWRQSSMADHDETVYL